MVAVQEPVFPLAVVKEPDMVLPDTVPVYVTKPTATKRIVLPVRLPMTWRVSGGDDSLIVPSSAPAVCVHVTVNMPLIWPVYCPVHAPLRLREGGAGLAVLVGGARWMAPVAINDATPTARTTAPSDSNVLCRLNPFLIIDERTATG
jgi:hypothetical protein